MKSIWIHEIDEPSIVDYLPHTNNYKTYLFKDYDCSHALESSGWDSANCNIDEFYWILSYAEEIYEVLSRQYSLEPRKSLSIQDYHLKTKHIYIHIMSLFSLEPPTLVLFGNYPHDGYSCILAAICCYREIPYYIIHQISCAPAFALIKGGSRANPYDYSFAERIRPPREFLEKSFDSMPDTRDYLRTINAYLDNLEADGSYGYLPPARIRHFPSFRKIITSRSSLTQKLKHSVWGAWIKIKQNAFEKSLIKIENKYCIDDRLPYIFFAFQLQPEMTTSALGGRIYNDQFLVAAILADLASKYHLRLVIKEHPLQSHSHRNISALEHLASLANVSFSPRNLSTQQLIKGSLCVATISGTTGLEGLFFGKKVICFGNTWYKEMTGVFENIVDLEEYLKSADKSPLPGSSAILSNRHSISQSLLDIANTCWPGSPWSMFTDGEFKLDKAVNLQIVAHSLSRFFADALTDSF
ncbi:MAG: hypothetical protein FJ333_10625 [Sphingomonadales bacterium]|nr:hypothetical protein [Sphingomonadales bacterium]